MVRDRRFDLLDADRLFALRLGHQHLRGAGFVDHVDRLVRQFAVVDVARGKLDRRLHRLVGVADLVELLEIRLQPLEDFNRVFDRRLVDVDLLEPANQRAVLFEILPIFLVGRRADAAQHALRERRLQEVRGVHRAAGRGAGANHGVDFVDEQDRVLVLLDLLHHLLEALLEVAAIARARQQRAHVERKHRRAGSTSGTAPLMILCARPSAIAVLPTPGSPTSSGLFFWRRHSTWIVRCDLGFAADQRIDPAVLGFLVEVYAVGVERGFLFLLFGSFLRILGVARFVLLFGAARRLGGVRQARPLGDAMADVIDRVVARHVLLLQEERGMAFAFGENRHQHIGARHLFAARRLDVNHRALHDALESGGRLGLLAGLDDQVFEFRIDILGQILAQDVEIDAAGAHHRGRVAVVDQRQQEMFQRRIFVPPLVGDGERPVQGLFQCARKRRHCAPFTSFP